MQQRRKEQEEQQKGAREPAAEPEPPGKGFGKGKGKGAPRVLQPTLFDYLKGSKQAVALKADAPSPPPEPEEDVRPRASLAMGHLPNCLVGVQAPIQVFCEPDFCGGREKMDWLFGKWMDIANMGVHPCKNPETQNPQKTQKAEAQYMCAHNYTCVFI